MVHRQRRARGQAPIRGIGEKIMLTEDEKGACGCLFVVGLVLACFAIGMAFEPWAGFALGGVAFMALALAAARGKKKGAE